MTYTLTVRSTVLRDSDGAHIPADLRNADYQAYLVWAYGRAEADALHDKCFGAKGDGNVSPSVAGLSYVNAPAPYVAPPPPAPSCALWQLQAVMTPSQWTAAQAAVAALNNPAVSAFFAHGTNVIPADSKTLLALGEAIGLTADQIAALVTEAAAVAIP